MNEFLNYSIFEFGKFNLRVASLISFGVFIVFVVFVLFIVKKTRGGGPHMISVLFLSFYSSLFLAFQRAASHPTLNSCRHYSSKQPAIFCPVCPGVLLCPGVLATMIV